MTSTGRGIGSGPVRVQLRRTRGWRLPEGAVSVVRPSRWGNPFKVGEMVQVGPSWRGGATWVRDAEMAVRLYRQWITTQKRAENIVPLLRGRDLACWCRLDQPCHANVLLALANPGMIDLTPIAAAHLAAVGTEARP